MRANWLKKWEKRDFALAAQDFPWSCERFGLVFADLKSPVGWAVDGTARSGRQRRQIRRAEIMEIRLFRSLRATRVIAVWCATLAGALMTGGLASASQVSGLTVSLVPIGSGTSFVNGTFHVPAGGNALVFPFTLSVRMSGVVSTPFDTSSFATVMSWSASGGAVVQDIFTATASGAPSILGTQTMLVNNTGMLFRDSYYDADNEIFLPPFREMNDNVVDPDSEVYWTVGISLAAPPDAVIPISGSYVDKEIAQIRMGLAANVGSGSFTLQLTGEEPYGFFNANTSGFFSVTTQPLNLTIVPVPEPTTLAVLLPGLVVFGCVGLRRRMWRRTGEVGTAKGSYAA
jgi:hypothetical protein